MKFEKTFFSSVILITLLIAAANAPAQRITKQAATKAASRQSTNTAPIVFMTDFGIANDAVAICKGVILNIAPDARVFDITHLVTPFSIAEGARFLGDTAPYYPANAVFVAVVDPGVGSARKPVVIRTKRGQYFVLPDNGLITRVAERDGIAAAREIANPKWMIGAGISSTFHGRDIFSPVGAHLARGEDWTQVGPELALKDLVTLKLPSAKLDANGLSGTIIGLDDPFGNLITDASAEDFRQLGYTLGETVPIEVGEKQISAPFVKTFSDVPVSKPLLYIDSRGRLGLAINQGNFSETYKIRVSSHFFIPNRSKRAEKIRSQIPQGA